MCLVVLSRTRLAGEKIKIGGLELNTLKKLNGDKFGFPLLSIVLAKAIGLGATALYKYPCNFAGAISFGSMLNMLKLFFTKITITSAISRAKIKCKYKIKHQIKKDFSIFTSNTNTCSFQKGEILRVGLS